MTNPRPSFKQLQNLFISSPSENSNFLSPTAFSTFKNPRKPTFVVPNNFLTNSHQKTYSLSSNTKKSIFLHDEIDNNSNKSRNEDLLSEKKVREDMKTSAMIKLLNKRKNFTIETKKPSQKSISAMEPKINQKTINSVFNESFESRTHEEKNNQNSLRVSVSPILIKNEINKKLLQGLIRKKFKENHSFEQSTEFLRNFKLGQFLSKRFMDVNNIKLNFDEDEIKNKKTRKNEIAFQDLEELTSRLEGQEEKIKGIRKQMKEARIRMYHLSIKIQQNSLEKERFEFKFDKKIREVRESQIHSQNMIILESEENAKKNLEKPKNDKKHEIENFMKVSQIEDEKSKCIGKIITSVREIKKEMQLLREKIKEIEAEIKVLKENKDIVFYEFKTKAEEFLSKQNENYDFVKIFKLFLRIDYTDFEQILPEFLNRKDTDYYQERAKKKLEIEKLIKERKKIEFKPNTQTSSEFLRFIEEKCKFIKSSLNEGKKTEYRSKSANKNRNSEEVRYEDRFQRDGSISPNDLKHTQKLKEIDLRVREIEKELTTLEENYKNSKIGKRKMKSFHK